MNNHSQLAGYPWLHRLPIELRFAALSTLRGLCCRYEPDTPRGLLQEMRRWALEGQEGEEARLADAMALAFSNHEPEAVGLASILIAERRLERGR